jgi:hypothetical protein
MDCGSPLPLSAAPMQSQRPKTSTDETQNPSAEFIPPQVAKTLLHQESQRSKSAAQTQAL